MIYTVKIFDLDNSVGFDSSLWGVSARYVGLLDLGLENNRDYYLLFRRSLQWGNLPSGAPFRKNELASFQIPEKFNMSNSNIWPEGSNLFLSRLDFLTQGWWEKMGSWDLSHLDIFSREVCTFFETYRVALGLPEILNVHIYRIPTSNGYWVCPIIFEGPDNATSDYTFEINLPPINLITEDGFTLITENSVNGLIV